jgi:molecular chaperone GrpE
VTENGRNDNEPDDVYVIEDTGESLADFEAPEESSVEPAGESQRGNDTVSPARDQIDQIFHENRELRDQLLRAQADFQNFRKRSEREKADYFKYALGQSVLQILPVVDNFERALAAEGGSDEFRTGVELIYKQLREILQKLGLTEVGEEGEPFDPTRHEAVMREENSEIESHTVMAVLQKGYFLHDRLLRPAMVKVSVGGPHREPQQPEEAQE